MLAVQVGAEGGFLPELKRKKYVELLKEMKADLLLLSCCEFFYEGEERKRRLDALSRLVTAFTSDGYPPFLWITTLGWGNDPGPGFRARFQNATRLTSFDGSTCFAVCTLDQDFKAYICENIRDFVRAGVKKILLDDDLVQSVRPGFLCTCPLHLSEFAKKAGKTHTGAEIQSLFTGDPSPLRSAYLDLMGETMISFCQSIRDAADSVDPSVRIGLCASYTDYDAEGVDMEALVRLLAGKGNRPFLRFSGAPYWVRFAQRYPGETLGAVCEFVRMQAAWFDSTDVETIDENDCHPRNTRVVPAAFVEQYDKAMIASGIGRHKYILCFDPSNPAGDRNYFRAHVRNLPKDEILTRMFHAKKAVGWHIHYPMHALKDAKLPNTYPGNRAMMALCSQPYGGIFAAENSQPTCYSGAGSGIAFGEAARKLTDEEIKSGLFLDLSAARILSERGIDVGLQRIIGPRTASVERFPNGSQSFSESDDSIFHVEPKSAAAICSFFNDSSGDFPAVYTYTNSNQNRFAVLCADGFLI